MRTRLLRACAALLLAAALAACSATRLAYFNVGLVYANADTLLAWMADDYFDLNDGQKDWVGERLRRTVAWHRAEELPAWQRFLEWAAQKADEPYRAEDVARGWEELRGFYRRPVERLVPSIAELVQQLDAEQVAYLERRFAKENRRQQEEYSGREAAADRRADRLLAHLEEFTGALDRTQRALVHRRVAAFPDLTAERIAEWRKRQAEMMALVRARPPLAEAEPWLRRITVDAERNRAPDYARRIAERDRLMQSMIVELSASLTREQREYLKRRLRGFAQDLRTSTASS